jgi:protein-disulfide isomerase
MPSGKRSKQQRRTATATATAVRTPPPVRSKGAPRARGTLTQASPRVLAIGGGVVALVVVAVVLGIVLSGGGSSALPKDTPPVGSATGASALPGAPEIQQLYQGIPQRGLYLGSDLAPVQMVMYIDLQCPICQSYEVTALPTIVRKYIRTGKVRLYTRPWAFIGPDSHKGRDAMIAASLQNKAYQFAGVLYDNQGPENSGWLTNSVLAGIASSVQGLKTVPWWAARGSAQVKAAESQVDADVNARGVTGTPTVFVGKNGTKPKSVSSPGTAPTLEQTEAAIQAALGS